MIELLVGPLVRAMSADQVVIWAEFSSPCWVTLQASADDTASENGTQTHSVTTHTVSVGGRHYAAPQLRGLRAATWYSYQLLVQQQKDETPRPTAEALPEDTIANFSCFRTFDGDSEPANSLRIAYGSCRKSGEPEQDALSAFGEWLLHHRQQREEGWPRLLLLIGDQIYADRPPPKLQAAYPSLRDGAQNFSDFATLYAYVWTQDKGVRQALAVIPTFMIFDDHEITNNWNVSPRWRAEMIRQGHEELLIDGLVAYWVYQGWGNSVQDAQTQHSPLLAIMQQAEESGEDGEDVLEQLRACLKQEVYDQIDLPWHYTIASQPPIFVMNARADRSTVFSNDEQAIYATGRIMGQEQMEQVRAWVKEQNMRRTGLSILVSSVPVLLPPVIGLAEYIMGVRLWRHGPAVLRKLGLRLAHLQLRMALKTSFDHWPTFAATWQELMQIVDESQQDFLLLSGDVHFSYAMDGQRPGKSRPHLYQLVCTPLLNKLNKRDTSIIMQQSWIKWLFYGGLLLRVLPMQNAHKQGRIHHDLLLQNTLALVTIHPRGPQEYTVEQVYMGVFDGQMTALAKTMIP